VSGGSIIDPESRIAGCDISHDVILLRSLSTLKLCFLAVTLGIAGPNSSVFIFDKALCQAGTLPLLSLLVSEFWKRLRAGGFFTWVGDQPSRSTAFFAP